MSDPGSGSSEVDLLARTDRFLDALAAGESVDGGDDDMLATLLGDWRDELRQPPAPALMPAADAVAALSSGLTVRMNRPRGLALVASVAAALLAFGGLGVMVGDAQPGGPLYSVHTVLFGEAPVNDDQIELAARSDLAEVQQLIARGQWDQAQTKLASVNDSVQNVNDTHRKQNLIEQLNQLNAKVANRDPNATIAPG